MKKKKVGREEEIEILIIEEKDKAFEGLVVEKRIEEFISKTKKVKLEITPESYLYVSIYKEGSLEVGTSIPRRKNTRHHS